MSRETITFATWDDVTATGKTGRPVFHEWTDIGGEAREVRRQLPRAKTNASRALWAARVLRFHGWLRA